MSGDMKEPEASENLKIEALKELGLSEDVARKVLSLCNVWALEKMEKWRRNTLAAWRREGKQNE